MENCKRGVNGVIGFAVIMPHKNRPDYVDQGGFLNVNGLPNSKEDIRAAPFNTERERAVFCFDTGFKGLKVCNLFAVDFADNIAAY